MNLTIAAIRSGTEPVGKLPDAAFHRWLESAAGLPEGATRELQAWWWIGSAATSRWFDEESRGLIRMLEEGDPDGAWIGASRDAL